MRHWFTHYESRKLEWSISIYTLIFGLALMLPPSSMSTAGYSPVLALLPERGWGMLYTTVGAAHMVALHINGRGAWTPFTRLAALTINSQVFLAMSLSFAASNPYGTAVITYGSLGMLFCGMAIWAAALDCGREIAIWQRHRRYGG